MLIVSKLVLAGGVAAAAMAGPATLGTTSEQSSARAVIVSSATQAGSLKPPAAVPSLTLPSLTRCPGSCDIWQMLALRH